MTGGGGMALPRLPDENRGPRPFRASAVSVVERRLGVDTLSLRVGGAWFPAFAGMTGGWGRPYSVSPMKIGVHVPSPASAVSVVDRRLGGEALSLRAGGCVDSGFRRNDGGIHVPPNPHFALPIPNSVAPNPQGQRLDSSPRPTTETAEARKGRGPRFSSGRRSRAAPQPVFPPPVIPANAGNHAPPNPQGQRVDSSLRPTTETAEARKGRGPRFSSGRRSRATPPPVIPAKAGNHAPPHPQGQRVDSQTTVNH